MKAILTHVTGGDADEGVLDAALSVARRFDAHIDVLHTRVDPSELSIFSGGETLAASVPELLMAIERDADRLAKRAKRHFDRWAKAHQVMVGRDAGQGPGVSAAWHETTGMPQRTIARAGRVVDLIVASRLTDVPSEQTPAELQAILFDTGRPVLLVPRGIGEIEPRSAVVAWNGSLEASRTIGLSMPIIAAFDEVVVATAVERNVEASDAEALVTYLARHGIRATSSILDATGGLGPGLLDFAENAAADLLIMGAYTHSRVRQLVFGGVTRHVLGNARIPVLMSR